MSWMDVVTNSEGGLTIRGPGAVLTSIMIDGRVVTAGPGWRARGVYMGFSPYCVVDLANDTGDFAFWILDENFHFLGSETVPMPLHYKALFVAALATRLRGIAFRFLHETSAQKDRDIQDFFRLQRGLRQHLFALVPESEFVFRIPRIVDLATTDSESWEVSTPKGPALMLTKDRMMRVLHHWLHERFLEACRKRKLEWPLLTQPEMGDKVHCIFFRYDFGVLRCVDHETGLLYYVVLRGADIVPVAVLIPQSGIMFVYSVGVTGLFMGTLESSSDNIGFALSHHVLRSAAKILDWIQDSPKSFATFMWPEAVAHLGHFLWNEASGLELIVEHLQPSDYPQIFNLAASSGCEFYAPLESLYPELGGRVNKSEAHISSMQDVCYATGVQPMRVSSHRVSAKIRHRLMNVVRADPDVQMSIGLGGPAFNKDMPVIVLGLRLSDRTHHDLAGFYCQVIDRLLTHVPQLTVVIDGLNARPGAAFGTTFTVFSGGDRPTDLYAREKRVVAEIRTAIAGRPVHIIDCVGSSMRLNLFWIDRASMFVCPWGAGLVKYRWVCNKLGFVFSSRNNLTQPHHLPIYHLPQFMEDPTELEFADPAHVTDLRMPGEILDSNGRDLHEQRGGLSAVNFTLDREPVLDRISALFLRSLSVVPPATDQS